MRTLALLALATLPLLSAETVFLDASVTADFAIEITGQSSPTKKEGFLPMPFSVVCWDTSSSGSATMGKAANGDKAIVIANTAGAQHAVQLYTYEPLKVGPGAGTLTISWQADGGSGLVKVAGAKDTTAELNGESTEWQTATIAFEPKDGALGLQIQYFGDVGKKLMIKQIAVTR